MFMRLVTRGAVLILSLSFFASCGGNDDKWAVYTSGEGGFSINMPAKPEKTEKVEVTPFGKQKVHFITWKPSTFSIDKFKLFEVSYTDCPSRFSADSVIADFMLDSSIRMRIKDFTEKDYPAETIMLNGYPGKSFILDNGGNTVIVKQCITNGRRYDLVVVGKSGQGTNHEISEFFNSFKALN
jgi:hypothetical protein